MMRRVVWVSLLALAGICSGCDPCEGEDCSGHGICVVKDGKAVCECDDYFRPGYDDPLSCEAEVWKPILYLYPTEQTTVSVRFAAEAEVRLIHTYPEYGPDGWRVVADPDGTLHDAVTGMEYYALYWEAVGDLGIEVAQGFVVKGEDTAAFLESCLATLGLSRREANEFIVFWLPRLEGNPYNLIHFATDAYDAAIPIHIQPPPDSLIRVYMLHRPLQEPQSIEPQVLTSVARTGFVAVEWGGGAF